MTGRPRARAPKVVLVGIEVRGNMYTLQQMFVTFTGTVGLNGESRRGFELADALMIDLAKAKSQ
jgi:hypothetical protein